MKVLHLPRLSSMVASGHHPLQAKHHFYRLVVWSGIMHVRPVSSSCTPPRRARAPTTTTLHSCTLSCGEAWTCFILGRGCLTTTSQRKFYIYLITFQRILTFPNGNNIASLPLFLLVHFLNASTIYKFVASIPMHINLFLAYETYVTCTIKIY